MAFETKSLANVAFKKTLGKAHTKNTNAPANEAESSDFIVAGQSIWTNPVPRNPTAGTNGVVSDVITLKLEQVPGAPSYVAKLDSTVPASLNGKINPKTGVAFVAGDRVGNIVPEHFGDLTGVGAETYYTPILKKGATRVQATDPSDWFLDCQGGIVTHEDISEGGAALNLGSTGTLECRIYTGDYGFPDIGEIQGAAQSKIVTITGIDTTNPSTVNCQHDFPAQYVAVQVFAPDNKLILLDVTMGAAGVCTLDIPAKFPHSSITVRVVG